MKPEAKRTKPSCKPRPSSPFEACETPANRHDRCPQASAHEQRGHKTLGLRAAGRTQPATRQSIGHPCEGGRVLDSGFQLPATSTEANRLRIRPRIAFILVPIQPPIRPAFGGVRRAVRFGRSVSSSSPTFRFRFSCASLSSVEHLENRSLAPPIESVRQCFISSKPVFVP